MRILTAQHFGVDRRAAAAGVREPLQHEHRRTFAHHEAAAVHVERSAGLRGIGVIGQHAHVVKAGRKQRMDRLGAAGQREIALAVANRADRFQDGDRAAGAGRGVAQPRTAEIVVAGHDRAGRVGKPLFPPRPLAGRDVRGTESKSFGDKIGVAHVGADRAAESLAIDRAKMDAGIAQRFGGRLSTEWDVLELAGKLAVDIDRGGEQHAVGNARQTGESTNAARAALDRLPNSFSPGADRRHDADAGDHHAIIVREEQWHWIFSDRRASP